MRFRSAGNSASIKRTIKKEGSRKKCEKRCNKYLESQKTDVSSTEDEIRNFENKAESLKSKSILQKKIFL